MSVPIPSKSAGSDTYYLDVDGAIEICKEALSKAENLLGLKKALDIVRECVDKRMLFLDERVEVIKVLQDDIIKPHCARISDCFPEEMAQLIERECEGILNWLDSYLFNFLWGHYELIS